MRTKALLIFLLFILAVTGAMVAALESRAFARFAKKIAVLYLPKNLGVEIDFSSFSLKMFPPGIAVDKPVGKVIGKNPANLPVGTEVKAESLAFSFQPLQAISGRVTVDEVRVIGGYFATSIEPSSGPKQKVKFSWENLLSIKIRSFVLIDTKINLGLPTLSSKLEFLGKRVHVRKETLRGQEFIGIESELESINISAPDTWKFATSLDQIVLHAKFFEDALMIEHAQVSKLNSSVVAEGALEGDVLAGRNLFAALKLTLETESNEFLDFIGVGESVRKSIHGKINFTGEASLRPHDPVKTLSAKGTLSARGVDAYGFQVDHLRVEGGYSAITREIKVSRLIAETKETPRIPGKTAGSGGRIDVEPFEISPSAARSFFLPIRLSKAHLNWLFGPVIATMYPLEAVVSGSIGVTLNLPTATSPLQISGTPVLQLENLVVDNQVLGQTKQQFRVLEVPALKLEGPILLQGETLSFQGVRTYTPKTDLLTHGYIKLSKHGEFNLKGKGKIDFSDFNVVAENKIKGHGQIGIEVVGPSDRLNIHLSPELEETEFLNFKLGKLQGKLTWEDRESKLVFQPLEWMLGRTLGTIDGELLAGPGVREEDRLNLRVRIPQGGHSDFYELCGHYLRPFWWYPEMAKASVQAFFKITGGLALPKLHIEAEMQANNGVWLGERFRSFFLKGSYNLGAYQVTTARLEKGGGSIQGQFALSPKNEVTWNIDTKNLSLVDFDRIKKFDLPIRGAISAHSEGKGTLEIPEGSATIQFADLSVQGRDFADSTFRVNTKQGSLEVAGDFEEGRGQFQWLKKQAATKETSFRFLSRDLDLSPLLLLIQPDLQKSPDLKALLSLQIDHQYKGQDWSLGTGTARLSNFLVRNGPYFLQLEKPVTASLSQGQMSEFSQFVFLQRGEPLRLSAKLKQGRLSGQVLGRIDLGVLELLVRPIELTVGSPAVSLELGGPVLEPVVSGEIRFHGEQIKLGAIENRFEALEGSLGLDAKGVVVRNLESAFAGGRVSLSGRALWAGFAPPSLDLKAQVSGSRIKVFPFQFLKVKGGLTLKGDSLPYLAQGSIFVESGLSKERLSQSRGASAKSLKYAPLPKETVIETSLIALDIQASSTGNIIVKNEFLDLEGKGEMRLQGTLEKPYPIGIGRAVQGKILFKDQVFQIQSGTMEFDTPGVVNPKFEVTASTDVASRCIQMLAVGRLDKYRIEFTSNPSLPESEILSLLALGVTRADQQSRQTADRSTVEQGEAASLVLHSLDFNREVKDKTGLSIGVDEAMNTIGGQSIFRPRNDTDNQNITAPKIVIRRQIGRRVGLSVGSTVGVGSSIQRNVKAEVRVNERFSVLGAWDTFEGQTSDLNRRNSYGVDLKLQKRFK